MSVLMTVWATWLSTTSRIAMIFKASIFDIRGFCSAVFFCMSAVRRSMETSCQRSQAAWVRAEAGPAVFRFFCMRYIRAGDGAARPHNLIIADYP